MIRDTSHQILPALFMKLELKFRLIFSMRKREGKYFAYHIATIISTGNNFLEIKRESIPSVIGLSSLPVLHKLDCHKLYPDRLS